MHYKGKLVISWVILCVLVLTGLALADDVKNRMRERLPVILDLKVRGIVGENNQGYLELLKGQTEKKEVVADENKDRRMVYEAIAGKTGTSLQVVGQRRAVQIAEKAESGEWLQDTAGKWYRKP